MDPCTANWVWYPWDASSLLISGSASFENESKWLQLLFNGFFDTFLPLVDVACDSTIMPGCNRLSRKAGGRRTLVADEMDTLTCCSLDITVMIVFLKQNNIDSKSFCGNCRRNRLGKLPTSHQANHFIRSGLTLVSQSRWQWNNVLHLWALLRHDWSREIECTHSGVNRAVSTTRWPSSTCDRMFCFIRLIWGTPKQRRTWSTQMVTRTSQYHTKCLLHHHEDRGKWTETKHTLPTPCFFKVFRYNISKMLCWDSNPHLSSPTVFHVHPPMRWWTPRSLKMSQFHAFFHMRSCMRWHVQVQIRYGGSSVKKWVCKSFAFRLFLYMGAFSKIHWSNFHPNGVWFSCCPPTLVESKLIPETLAVWEILLGWPLQNSSSWTMGPLFTTGWVEKSSCFPWCITEWQAP